MGWWDLACLSMAAIQDLIKCLTCQWNRYVDFFQPCDWPQMFVMNVTDLPIKNKNSIRFWSLIHITEYLIDGQLPDFIFLAGRRSSLRAIRETQSLKVTCHLKKYVLNKPISARLYTGRAVVHLYYMALIKGLRRDISFALWDSLPAWQHTGI